MTNGWDCKSRIGLDYDEGRVHDVIVVKIDPFPRMI